MLNYGLTYSQTKPEEVEMTENKVFVASDITNFSQVGERGEEIQGYQYNLVEYTKDEYLLKTTAEITALREEFQAAKILLGVE